MSQNRYRADLRDLRFVLFEQFELGRLLGHGKFADWGEEEVDLVLREAYRFATEVAGPLAAVGDREGCTLGPSGVKTPSGFKEAYEKLYEGGFKAIFADPEYGGAGGPKALGLLVTELTSGANAALDMYAGLTLGAAEMLYEFGTDAQKAHYLAKMFGGQWAGTMCLTEPAAGSDVGECTTRAVLRPDGGYEITGTKIFISGGDQDITDNIVHMVLARIDGAEKGTRGLSLFIVPKVRADGSTNHVQVGSIEHKMGLNGSATCVLNFGEGGASLGELMGGVSGQGMRQMFQMMNFARISVGVQGLACAGTAYLNALQYARERKQGASAQAGKDPNAPRVPILEHADIRRMLLEMKAKVEGMRAMAVKAAWHHDAETQTEDAAEKAYHKGQVELLTPLIKAYASDQAFRIADMAIQIYGGAGYSKDHPVERYCRDAKVFAIYEGTNHIQALDLVGRKLRLDKGAHAQAFFKDVKVFVAKHRSHPELGAAVSELDRALDALGAAVLAFGGWSGAQLLRVGLVASPFLEAMSEVCVGWLLLQAAVIAHAKGGEVSVEHPDHAFYRGKVFAAQHYAHWVVSTIAARARLFDAAPASALDIEDAMFATV
jgi:alkylation response protein AidB-like acyl-CoA dehydrogenase